MINLGLSYAERVSLYNLLRSSHRISISASLMDLNNNRLADLSSVFMDGQVNVDAGAEITRSASLAFYDPNHKMGLDSESPANGALYLDRQISVYYCVQTVDRKKQYVVPVFRGPVTKIDRDWAMVSVECQGKDIFGLGGVWKPKSYKKGAFRTSVIKDILRNVMGEIQYQVPDLTYRLPKDLAMGTESKPWLVAKSLARGMGYQLFFDGRGVAVMRPYPRTAAWTFRDDAGGDVLSKPQVGYDVDNLINAVRVIGVQTKGKKKLPLVYVKYAPASHPLNPWKLGRNGVPRMIFEEIKDDGINTKAEAAALASARLERGLLEPVTVSFDMLPNPLLEESDVFRLETDEFNTPGTVQKMTIPLTASKATFGYLRNTRLVAANIRRKRK